MMLIQGEIQPPIDICEMAEMFALLHQSNAPFHGLDQVLSPCCVAHSVECVVDVDRNPCAHVEPNRYRKGASRDFRTDVKQFSTLNSNACDACTYLRT